MRWNVPRLAPHGPSGAALVATGGHEIWQALHGHLCAPELAATIATLTIWNACSGASLVLSSRSKSATLFKTVTTMQCCLAYELLRFSFETPMWFFTLDALCGMALMGTLLNLVYLAETFDASVRAVIIVGVIVASTFSLYPLQMGFFQSTWTDALNLYPDQLQAMATYVYAPTCVVVSVVMFGATLYDRKIIGQRGLFLMALLLPMTLVGTVLSQDAFFGDTSTQQLILGFPASDITPYIRSLMFRAPN